jgi:hypothetical protein
LIRYRDPPSINMSRAICTPGRDAVNRSGGTEQDIGLKSQDRAGPVVLNSNHNNKKLFVLCHWRSRWQATTAAPQLSAENNRNN